MSKGKRAGCCCAIDATAAGRGGGRSRDDEEKHACTKEEEGKRARSRMVFCRLKEEDCWLVRLAKGRKDAAVNENARKQGGTQWLRKKERVLGSGGAKRDNGVQTQGGSCVCVCVCCGQCVSLRRARDRAGNAEQIECVCVCCGQGVPLSARAGQERQGGPYVCVTRGHGLENCTM